jgi:hypothetical protein
MSLPDYWWPYIYQYSVGGFIFVFGMYLILRNRACVLNRPQDRFWFTVLIIGFIWYATMHLSWFLAGIYWNPQIA